MPVQRAIMKQERLSIESFTNLWKHFSHSDAHIVNSRRYEEKEVRLWMLKECKSKSFHIARHVVTVQLYVIFFNNHKHCQYCTEQIMTCITCMEQIVPGV